MSKKNDNVVFLPLYVFTQPLYLRQYVTQGLLLSRVQPIWIRSFLSWLVVLPKLKKPVCPGKEMDAYLSQRLEHEAKCKQPCPRFWLRLSILFPWMITVMLRVRCSLMVKLHSRSSEECEVTSSLSLLPGSLRPHEVIIVRGPQMNQMD